MSDQHVSVWGRVSSPQVTPCIVSKNAVRAFSECLRGELADEPDIQLEILYALSPRLYRRLAHPAFLRGPMSPLATGPTAGNVLEGAGPHTVGGGWRGRRRPALRRAFAAAALGIVAGSLRRNPLGKSRRI